MPVTDEMVCFSLYAATRATNQAYRAVLEPWGLTYPQYLVLITLWVEGDQSVTSLGELLQLDSGTLSPLLRRMELAGLVTKQRRSTDERVVTVTVTERGRELRAELSHVPRIIADGMGLAEPQHRPTLISSLQSITAGMQAVTAGSSPSPATPPIGALPGRGSRKETP